MGTCQRVFKNSFAGLNQSYDFFSPTFKLMSSWSLWHSSFHDLRLNTPESSKVDEGASRHYSHICFCPPTLWKIQHCLEGRAVWMVTSAGAQDWRKAVCSGHRILDVTSATCWPAGLPLELKGGKVVYCGIFYWSPHTVLIPNAFMHVNPKGGRTR